MDIWVAIFISNRRVQAWFLSLKKAQRKASTRMQVEKEAPAEALYRGSRMRRVLLADGPRT